MARVRGALAEAPSAAEPVIDLGNLAAEAPPEREPLRKRSPLFSEFIADGLEETSQDWPEFVEPEAEGEAPQESAEAPTEYIESFLPYQPSQRRPSRLRQSEALNKFAYKLAVGGVTPNQVSQTSVTFAILGLIALWSAPQMSGVVVPVLYLVVAVSVVLRMLCNLLDGMIAVEFEQGTPSGRVWNELSDRFSDSLLLWGLGLAAGWPSIGLICALLAFSSAWIREVSRAEGLGEDFGGPLGRNARMWLLFAASLGAVILPLTSGIDDMLVMQGALAAMLLGLIATLGLRGLRLVRGLSLRDMGGR